MRFRLPLDFRFETTALRYVKVAAFAFASLSAVAQSPAASADSIFVDPATGSGVNDSDLTTATTLITGAVGEVGTDTLTNQEDQADFVLRPTLVRLGEAYLLGLSKVRSGKIIASSQLKAARMDELDKVALRLTRSVLIGERAQNHPRVGEITDHEAREGAQRRPTRSETYLAFGGTTLNNLNSSGIGYAFGIGHAWDINTASIKVVAHGDIVGSAWILSGGLGGNYFFSTTDIAPYVTADFGAGAAKIDGGGVLDGQTVGGFSIGVGAGVQFLRTSAVNLDLGFRAGYILRANPLGTPQTYALRLGLYF